MSYDARLSAFWRAQVTEVDIESVKNYGGVRIYIPGLMPDLNAETSEGEGIIAFPACNFSGGRSDINTGSVAWGSSYVPVLGEWVWIFFEAGDLRKPYYFAAYNGINMALPPDATDSPTGFPLLEPHKSTVIYRSPAGRSIVVCDDASCPRIEITGARISPATMVPTTQWIDFTQNTIILDETPGGEKLLIQTKMGDFFKLDITNQKLEASFMGGITFQTLGNFEINTGGNFKVVAVEKVGMTCNGMEILNAGSLISSCLSEDKMVLTKSIESVTGVKSIKASSLIIDTLSTSIKAAGLVTIDGIFTFGQCKMSLTATNAQPAQPTIIQPVVGLRLV